MKLIDKVTRKWFGRIKRRTVFSKEMYTSKQPRHISDRKARRIYSESEYRIYKIMYRKNFYNGKR